LQNKSLIAGILLISSPTLFALAAYPDTISMSWNEGRGGFLFAVVFIVAELVGIKLEISRKKLLAIIPLAILVIIYLVALDYGLQDYIQQVGESYEVPLIYSWIWLWDYVVMTVFVVATLLMYSEIGLLNRMLQNLDEGESVEESGSAELLRDLLRDQFHSHPAGHFTSLGAAHSVGNQKEASLFTYHMV